VESLALRRGRKKLVKEDKPDKETRLRAKKKKIGNHTELAVRALTDMKAFADLINFHGGWDNFSSCHDELVSFICFPQTNETALQKLKFNKEEKGAGLRRLVLMPRGHLKSTIGTVLYTLWRIYRNPDIRILVACNLQNLAFSFIRELRSYLERKELESVWNNRPHIEGPLLPALDKRNQMRNTNDYTEAQDKKVIWNNTAIQVNRIGSYKEPTVFATSVGTTVTGMHYDLIILDDLIDFKNIESETKKNQIEEWIADVESVLNPPEVVELGASSFSFLDTVGGEILVNGTRYSIDDYYGRILENQHDWHYIVFQRSIYKNGVDASEGYLWPERYNDEVVANLQKRLSPRRFASQYLNKVFDKDNALFDVSQIRVVPSSCFFTYAGSCYFRHQDNSRLDKVFPVIAVDPAFSTSKTADYCAILAGFKLIDGTLVVQDATIGRLSANEVVEAIKNMALAFQSFRVFFEENGVGKLLGDLLKNEKAFVNGRPLVAFGHYEQRIKDSKIQGVLELPIASGKIWISEKVRNNEEIWKELSLYPITKHDDFLDALVTLWEKTNSARESIDYSVFASSQIQSNARSFLPLDLFNHQSFLSSFNSFFA
jgi:predicted phage terminase large subunit-like protein